MDAQTIEGILQLTGTVGFPIAAFFLVWKYMTGEFKQIVDKLSEVVEKNTQALTNGTAVIQYCKDVNKE